jgi:CheY-like chemotaxis protein
MKLLIVEDNDEFIIALREIVAQSDSTAQCSFAQSKESASAKIEHEFFDLILLDLNIPTADDAQDGTPAHGHAVFAHSRVVAPGTPIIVLTGSSAEEFIPSLLEHSTKTDVWGGNTPVQMVAFHAKHKLDSFPSLLGSYIFQILKLKDIELRRNGINLSDSEDRLVRIFARRSGGTKVSIFHIGGGLSDARVFRLKVTNAAGLLVHHAISKIGPPETIKDENYRYTKYLARLRPEATPRKLDVLEYGAKTTSGVFYGLAEGFDLNMFHQVNSSKDSEHIINKLEHLLSPWKSAGEARKSVKDIRKSLLNDDKYQDIRQYVSWSDNFEKLDIQVKWGCSHGDLHGLNILVSTKGIPVLIDYGDAGESPSCIDPITLELSLFFHPEGPLKNSDWPTPLQANNWGNLEVYLEGCPCQYFVQACRKWALNIAAGDREVAAVAYSYLMRQFKYPKVNKERVLALLNGVKAYYDQT